MSWFESSSFSSLAKTALNSAQKSIDRVLDIQDEGGNQGPGAAASLSQTTGKKSSGGGWSSWISPTSKQKASSSPTSSSGTQKKTSPPRNVETDEFFADFLGGTSQAKKSPVLKPPANSTPVPKQLPTTPSQTKISPRLGGLDALSPTEKHKQRKKQPGQFKLQVATSPTTSKPQVKEDIPNDAVVSVSLTENVSEPKSKENFDVMSSSSNSDLSASSESQSVSESGQEKEMLTDSTTSGEVENVSSKLEPLGVFKLDEVQINHVGREPEAKVLTGDSVLVSSGSCIESGETENSGLGQNSDTSTVGSTGIAVIADDSSVNLEAGVETQLEATLDASLSQLTNLDESATQADSVKHVRDENTSSIEDLEQTADGTSPEQSSQQTADMEEGEEMNLTEKLNEVTRNDTEEDHLRQQEPHHIREEEPPLVSKEESSDVEEKDEISSSSADREMPNSMREEDSATTNVQEMYREHGTNSETVDAEHNKDHIDQEKEGKFSQDESDSLEICAENEEDQAPDNPMDLNHEETESTGKTGDQPSESRDTEPFDDTDTADTFMDVEPETEPLDKGTGQDSVLDSSGQQLSCEEDSTSQNNALDPQKLLKKLADMAEVLQAREAKLLELSKQNMDLEETGNILRVSTVNDKQMAQLLQEKDEQIEALMEEGQKLSKQQLQSSNIIKKLRAKEKESDGVIKSQKERLDKLQENVDHLTHVLDAKEDIDKQQKDAIKKLNSALEKQTKELTIAKSELEEAQDRVRSMQSALDSSYKEIGELHKANAARNSELQDMTLSAQLQAKEELRLALEQEQEKANRGHEKLVQQVEDLRLSLQRAETQQSRQEDLLRQEISDMQQRLQQADARNQELSQSVTAATRPLLRQIENLQSNFSAQTSSWEKVEKNLTERLTESQSQLAEASEKERMATETMMETKARLTSLESKCALLRQEKSRLLAEIEMERAKVTNMEDARHREQAQLEALQKTSEKQKEDWTKEKLLLENQLEMERLRVDTEKKKTALAQEQAQKDRDRQWSKIDHGSRSHSRSSSVSDTSQNSSFFQPIQGDSSEPGYSPLSPMTNSTSGSLLDSMRTASTSTLFEGLQSTLKMREGEITQLQEEIVMLERQRAAMAEELVSLSSQNQDLLTQVEQVPTLSDKVKKLEQRYNTMLQMYGEKAEEADELKMDLEDIKAMYKQQISDLLSKMT
ncbi:TATA element modulatory factor-like [Branchiostoma floridae]|uniref:TATA element modulatory factor-like n=1 Tax=Branchiostoma floridae TaxID=7739 RepID=A0A9J7M724_BRAFL|nr:TATA element modulatory factor-like [Branchiostoma floridae]